MANEPAQPQVEADNISKATEQLIETLPAANAAPAKPEPATPAAPPAVLDMDDQELIDARAALALEQGGKPASADPKADVNPADALPKPAAPKDPAAPAQVDDDKSIMIPKPRLDEALRKADEARGQALYWQGVAEARKDMPKAAATEAKPDRAPAVPTPTIPQLLAEIDTQRVALATKYDEGELTAVEWEKQRTVLDNQAAQIRDEAMRIETNRIREEAKGEARREAMADTLDTHAETMDQTHPALLQMPTDANHPRWAFLREEAVASLAAKGVVLKTDDARSLKVFREEIANLADQYVPMWTGKAVPPAPAGASPTPANPAPKTSSVADQRLAKLTLAHQQPPNSADLGSSGVKPELSDTQVVNMSDDDIANLPAATRARITGRAA